MRKLSNYFVVPSPSEMEQMYPRGDYQLLSMTEPLPTNQSAAAIQAGLPPQEFSVLTLRKVVKQAGHIGATRPIRKTIFSMTNKVAWDIIEGIIESKKPIESVVFENCRLITLTSTVPYYPTRKLETGERVRMQYPQDKGDHKEGDDILTCNHKFFLFEDDSLTTELGRRLDTAEWEEDASINAGAEPEDVD